MLRTMALSRFTWQGLPDTINVDFLERCLYEDGMAVIYDDEIVGTINLRCSSNGCLNWAGEPTSFRLISDNGKINKSISAEECIVIYNNPLRNSTDIDIQLFAQRLTTCEISSDVNIYQQRTPAIIECDEKERLSFVNAINQYEDGRPFIWGVKGFNMENAIKVFNTNVSFVADKLQEQKQRILNEVYAFLGINSNPATDKKERLLTDEINANNEQINLMASSMLDQRQRAALKISEKYGCNVSVTFNKLTDSTDVEKEVGEYTWRNIPSN